MMSDYIEPLKTALLVYPFVALLFSGPFIWVQYCRYGSFSISKATALYTFLLYLDCAYCLVILPLPDPAAVAAMTNGETQLVPFRFLHDLVTKTPFRISQMQTWLAGLTDPTMLVPVYNILLVLPFGAFLRWYWGADKKRTVLFSFLLSLFFELTQLTGLYFLYTRGYRIFDVDDLLLNTMGGLLGWLCAKPLVGVLPSRAAMNTRALARASRRREAGLRLGQNGMGSMLAGLKLLTGAHLLSK